MIAILLGISLVGSIGLSLSSRDRGYTVRPQEWAWATVMVAPILALIVLALRR